MAQARQNSIDRWNYIRDGMVKLGYLSAEDAANLAYPDTVKPIDPNAGRVFFRGEEVTALPMYKRAQRGMGYLSQEPSVFQRLTVEENLLAVLESMTMSRRQRYQGPVADSCAASFDYDDVPLAPGRGRHRLFCQPGGHRRHATLHLVHPGRHTAGGPEP